MQERWRWLDLPNRVQSQVEPVSVADDDSAFLIFLSSGRVKAEIGRIELLAEPLVVTGRPRWLRCMTAALPTLMDNDK